MRTAASTLRLLLSRSLDASFTPHLFSQRRSLIFVVGGKKTMGHKSVILLLATLCAEAVLAAGAPPRTAKDIIQELLSPPPPRNVDDKVNDAGLIVRGEVVLLGEGKPVLYYCPRHKCAWMG